MFREFLNGGDNTVERCGMILGTPDHEHAAPPRNIWLVELPNRSEVQGDTYRIVRSDVNAALQAHGVSDDDIVGFWHTHPVPFLSAPSQPDVDSIMLGAKWWWHIVYHIASGTITWYDYHEQFIEEDDDARYLVRPRPKARVGRVCES